jgi:hypothetical protein
MIESSSHSEFTRDMILNFTRGLRIFMNSRKCEPIDSLPRVLPHMKLPPSNNVNISLQVYACQILFAIGVFELRDKGCVVGDDELQMAKEIAFDMTRKYNLAIGISPLGDTDPRARSYYKRDLIPVMTAYARKEFDRVITETK